jgi:crossover junction endodeoxyribonuclease RuvC
MKVGEVIGVIKLLAHERGIPLSGYTPLQIKQTIACYGRADKVQMQRMVQLILGLRELPKPNHAADALAVAVCHANSSRLAQLVRAS